MNLQLHTPPHPYDVAQQVGRVDGARVTLINLPVREQALPNNAPLGPALLAARLEALGVQCHIVDLNAYRPVLSDQEAKQLLWESFNAWGDQDLIALSGLITTLRWQTVAAKMVRELQPQAFLVAGGGLATQFRAGLFEWIPELDGVAHSEGDDVVVKIAHDALMIRKHGRKRAESSGMLAPYLRNDGKLLYAGDRPPDLDRLPLPAWHLLHEDVRGEPIMERYIKAPIWGGDAKNSSATPFNMTRSVNTVSSRGCPFACSFCFRGGQGERNYGVRSAEGLAEEMEWLVYTYGVDFVGITDDNFLVDRRRLERLPQVLPGVRYGSHGRLDEAADERRINAAAQSGCVYIGFGAESACPKTLEAMNKAGHMLSRGTVRINGYEVARTMVDGVLATRDAGVYGNCTWIRGWPGETLEDLKASIAFILWQEQELGVEVNRNIFVATAYPGTELWNHKVVRRELHRRFAVTEAHDDALRNYTLELNDATKLLSDRHGRPLNFSAMPDSVFAAVDEHVQAGDLESIMRM